ncbi:MAG: response regulator [Saprospiraceae bacterium]|nr:response regulator [Saprospiraceae bacterium]MDZ4705707.1 response regulator [Saprospiraceae bacterium]
MVLDDSLFNAEKIERIAAVEAKFETQKKEAQLAQQQLEMARKDNLRNQIIFIAIGVILALVGLFQYLRNRQKVKQKEAELSAVIERAETEKLREADTLKSTFFANISHEFRTPLTLIISPLEQLLNGTFKGDVRKYYGIMHRNGRRLLQLVNQLLDLSKLESGKMKLETEEGDIAAFVRAIAYSFESLAVRKLIDYRVLTPPMTITGFFDRDKLEKILTNLLSNAFKFTPENGSIELELKMPKTAQEHAGLVEIAVRDTGIGIPADQLPFLFDRFYSLIPAQPNQKTEHQYLAGTGIGLALTRELVGLHKGQIRVESTEGQGTQFLFTFFVENLAISQESPSDTLAGDKTIPILSIAETTRLEKPKMAEVFGAGDRQVVLIVEDNQDVRLYIRDQLIENYVVMEAGNGKQGLEMAVETTPDLVISDIMMPEMDGREFCRLVKSNEKTSHIPVVLLTAKADQSDKLEGLSLGADDYLIKPFDTRELQVRVANLIEQRRHLQERYRRSLHAFAPAEIDLESIDAAFLKKVREAVETNLEDETFSVVELGAAVNMSRSQLHRKLKALTGYAPNEVIRNMRLERAKAMLEKRAGNASEIAYMTGFNSPAYFAKCFKDYFGISPSEVG